MPQRGVLLFGDGPLHKGCACGSQVPALVQVANRPIAYHVLDAMVAAGVDEVVATGTADVLLDVRRSLAQYPERSLRVEYAITADGSNSTAALRAAAPFIGAAPCIVHVADGLVDQSLASHVAFLHERSADLVLLCPAPERTNGFSNEFSNEFSNGVSANGGTTPTVPSMLCDAGVGLFGPGAFRQACETDVTSRSLGLAALAQHLSAGGRNVEVHVADGWRRYRGNPHDLLEVNRLALDLLGPQVRHAASQENRIDGRVQIHESASITRSVIIGPVVVGEGAEISDAYLGPYTSVGPQTRIEGAEIERSIISAGASVMHVGVRLVSSLVGRDAHVFRDFSLPRAMRLRVGEGDEIALC